MGKRSKDTATRWYSKRSTRLLVSSGVLIIVAGVLLLFLFSRGQRRAEVFEEIADLGGTVHTFIDLPDWLPSIVAEYMSLLWGNVQVTFVDVELNTEQLRTLRNALERIDTIEVIGLAGENVSDRWLEQLGPLRHVNILFLEETTVTVNGCRELLQWEQLEFFNIRGNSHLTEDKVVFLKSHLPDLVIIADK